MKKSFIFVLNLFFLSMFVFSETPENYIEEKYGNKAVFFCEDPEDWIDDKKIGSQSPIFFYNSTDHEITFEFHEIKTRFGNVTSDKIFKIKGRAKKITLKPNQYFDTAITLDDIEHFLFLFEDAPCNIYAYADRISVLTERNTDGLFISGFGAITSSTEYYYSLVFEFCDD
ncbi:MAG: hypothetical protein SOX64_06500 [Treponema sp.]|nr:hypothetical protein [Treponema sp.]